MPPKHVLAFSDKLQVRWAWCLSHSKRDPLVPLLDIRLFDSDAEVGTAVEAQHYVSHYTFAGFELLV